MRRRGGGGVNKKQQRNKITPLSGNRPFSAEKKDFTKQTKGDIMSKSKANELLQELHTNLTANWTGKARFSSSDAIKMCREIVYEYDNDDSNRNNTADSVSADGEQ